jgi:saccharopine dehydrogenase-like NADP-dependent oxidoreductase
MWSPDGLINEYSGDCQIVRDGKFYEVPTLTGYETLMIDGDTYEAFNTSGGLGSFAKTISDAHPYERFANVDLNYKTIRYKGHHNLIDFLMNDLRIPKKELIQIIKRGVSTTRRDLVIIYVVVGGIENGKFKERVYKKFFYPFTENGRYYTAIESTTASGLLTMVELFLQGKLRKDGYQKQEDVKLSEAVNTVFGSLYIMK